MSISQKRWSEDNKCTNYKVLGFLKKDLNFSFSNFLDAAFNYNLRNKLIGLIKNFENLRFKL